MRLRPLLSALSLLTAFAAACSDAGSPTAPATAPLASAPSLTLVASTAVAAPLKSISAPGKCMDVYGGYTAAGTPAILYGCFGPVNQQFSWQSSGEIRVYGNMCLDGQQGQNGSQVVIQPCTGAASQKWVATVASEIRGLNNRCVDIWGNSKEDLAEIRMYDCHGGDNQKWDNGLSTPAVSSPAVAGVAVYPGESLQAKVNANPAGTTFLLKAGTYAGQSVVPKSGDAFVGEPGAVLDGGNTTPYAFWAGCCSNYPNNVQIRKLVIQNYATSENFGAVRVSDHLPANGGTDWTIDSCEIRYNNNAGVRVGTRTRVLRSNIHHNGEIGLTGAGDGIVVEGNEISYNNYQDHFDWTWNTGGGSKFVETTGLVVRNNFSHHNRGPGFWTDLNNINTTYEGNRIEDNADGGIFHEVSYAAVIRNNIIARNGLVSGRWLYGAGIVVSASPNVEVYGNTLTGNYAGITGIQQVRNEAAYYGPHSLDNLYVHNNNVTMQRGVTGIGQDVPDGQSYYTSRNNRFVANSYTLTGNATPFHWMDGLRTEAQWRGYGQDVSGTFVR